ncbi:MAG: phosphoglycerate dehydrogenase [Pseudomonadota bacterium]
MNSSKKVVVCSRSFSKNPILRKELLERYPLTTFNDAGLSLEGNSLVGFLKGHDKAITALETINENILEQLPELEVISKYGVGVDMIDMAAMRTYNKFFGWTGGVNCRSVSELVISFAIAMLRHVPAAHREVLSGTWRQHVGNYLSGRTVGIIGCGHIGKDLTPLLKAFGCKIIVNDIRDYPDFYTAEDIKPVSLETLLEQSDIVTIHTPLDNSTRDLLNAQRLSLLKPTAVLINAARGGLVDEVELKKMLQEKRLAAAAFDVFTVEPPQDKELLELPNFLVTPHIGGSAHEAILAMGRAAINGLDDNKIP